MRGATIVFGIVAVLLITLAIGLKEEKDGKEQNWQAGIMSEQASVRDDITTLSGRTAEATNRIILNEGVDRSQSAQIGSLMDTIANLPRQQVVYQEYKPTAYCTVQEEDKTLVLKCKDKP